MKNFDFIKVIKKKFNAEFITLRLNNINKQIFKSNKSIIILFSISFLYLCYLSIPALYNSKIIKTKLEVEIESLFNSKSHKFEKFTYTFFPTPHFNIKNIKIYDEKDKNLKIAEIKNINFFISQKNFFKKNDFEITSIKLINANININKKNFFNFNKLLSKPLNNKINIIKSKLFLNDNKNKTYSIISIKDLNLFFKDNKFNNIANINGNVFNLPFKLYYQINPFSKETNLKINFQKIKLNFESKSKSDVFYNSKNEIFFLNSKLGIDINNKENSNVYKINSTDSNINQTSINYSGNVNIQPFYFDFLFLVSNINLSKLIFLDEIFEKIFINFFFNNDYLNGKIKIKLSELKKNKYFDQGNIHLNIKRGKFDLSGSEFVFKNVGKIKIISNQFFKSEDKITLQLNTKFEINNVEKLYKKFLIPKKNRFNIENIYFLMDLYPSSNEIIFSSFEINDKDNDFYNSNNFTVNSWQDLRSMINQLLINYDG